MRFGVGRAPSRSPGHMLCRVLYPACDPSRSCSPHRWNLRAKRRFNRYPHNSRVSHGGTGTVRIVTRWLDRVGLQRRSKAECPAASTQSLALPLPSNSHRGTDKAASLPPVPVWHSLRGWEQGTSSEPTRNRTCCSTCRDQRRAGDYSWSAGLLQRLDAWEESGDGEQRRWSSSDFRVSSRISLRRSSSTASIT